MSARLIPTRYKVCAWGNPTSNRPDHEMRYGVQAYVPERGWMHCVEGSNVLLFPTREKAREEIRAIRLRAEEPRR